MRKSLLASLLWASISLIACGGGGESGADTQRPQTTDDAERILQNQNYMPAGFKLIGDHGYIQVDQDFYNLSLQNKGTIAVSTGNGTTITLPNAQTPVMCVRPTGGSVYYTMTAVGGGTVQAKFVAAQGTSPILTYYHFDRTTSIQDVSPGISVYRADGSIAFNSNQASMEIAGSFTLPGFSDTQAFPSGSLNVGSENRAFCLTGSKLLMTDGGGSRVAAFIADGLHFDGSTLNYGGVQVGQIATNGDAPRALWGTGHTVLLIDTTNL